MSKIKLEHIDALSKGKKSGINLGSRAVPHHLYVYEREEYERALKRWYLILDKTSRSNLENLWILVSKSYNRESIVLHKKDQRWYITSDWVIIFDWTLADAKIYLRNLGLSQ
jgi:hypothetical protein